MDQDYVQYGCWSRQLCWSSCGHHYWRDCVRKQLKRGRGCRLTTTNNGKLINWSGRLPGRLYLCQSFNGNFQGLLEIIIKITLFVELTKCLHSFSSAMHGVSAFENESWLHYLRLPGRHLEIHKRIKGWGPTTRLLPLFKTYNSLPWKNFLSCQLSDSLPKNKSNFHYQNNTLQK